MKKNIPPACITLAIWEIGSAQEFLEQAQKQLRKSRSKLAKCACVRIDNAIQDTVQALDDLEKLGR